MPKQRRLFRFRLHFFLMLTCAGPDGPYMSQKKEKHPPSLTNVHKASVLKALRSSMFWLSLTVSVFTVTFKQINVMLQKKIYLRFMGVSLGR